MELLNIPDLQGVRVVGVDLYYQNKQGGVVIVQDALVKIASGQMEVTSVGDAVSITQIVSAANLNLPHVESVFLENDLIENGANTIDDLPPINENGDPLRLCLNDSLNAQAPITEQPQELFDLPERIEGDNQIHLTAQLAQQSDSDVSSSDFITNVINPILQGTAAAGALVTLSVSGASYETRADNNEQWSVQVIEPLTDGVIQYVVRAEDEAGNHMRIEQAFIVDTIAPKLTGGLDPDSDSGIYSVNGITRINTPTFSGTGEPGAALVLTLGSEQFETTIDPNGEWKVVIEEPMSDGTYSYGIRTSDLDGRVSRLLGEVHIDTQLNFTGGLAPTSICGHSAEGGMTNMTRPSFSGLVEQRAKVRLVINDIKYDAEVSENGQWRATLPISLADGTYQYELIARDLAGNESTLADRIIIDTQAKLSGGFDTGSDSEVCNTGGLVKIVRPQFFGSGKEGSHIKVINGGQEYRKYTDEISNKVQPYFRGVKCTAKQDTVIQGNLASD
ncbi:Ig-like domain-containing protein [Rhodanobacter aciditrophus]|uniref:Ig-like domain-containing protein n=1 Tax=Rhodanobacter aciditrophus TaxID=1623218 RepID=A0ABW4B2N1_9GAMM